MKKLILLIILCIAGFYQIDAQQRRGGRGGPGGERQGAPKINIIGKLINSSTGQGLEYATISVFSKRDSSLVGGGLSEPDGTFTVEAKPGPMYAVIDYLGFESLIIDPIPFDRDKIRAGERKIDLGEVSMFEGGVALEEVEIRAEKSETQFSLDKKVFNVGKDLANQGGSAEDILDNVPSVTVDVEGEVSLRGSTGVRILIDGKPSGLASAGNGLRSIPSNMIDQVEVITNPGARYEAAGTSGIINIVLKKNTGHGFNGSFDVSVAQPLGYGAGANINYRKGKVNWFANYGFRYRSGPGGGTTYQETTRNDSVFILDLTRSMDRSGFNNSIRTGLDYHFTDNATLTGYLQYRKSDENNENVVIYNDFLQSINNPTSITDRVDDESEDESNLEYSLDYRNEIGGNRNHLFKATVQYRDDIETENSIFTETFNPLEGPSYNSLNQRSNNKEANKTWLVQMDYAKPLSSQDHKIEFGVRGSFRRINNDYLVEEENSAGIFESLAGLSNNFNYDEDVYAAYATYGNKHEAISYQLGLRAEYSDVNTELEQTNEKNPRSYFNLFPSAHFNYQINEANAVQVSYSRRIRRPRFWDLNPFFTFSDRRNFFSGNPNLDPEFSDSYEIGSIRYWEKATLSTSLFYRHTKDNMERIKTLLDDNTTLTFPQNLSIQDDYGLDVSINYSALKWWRLDGNANLFRSQTSGTFGDQDFSTDNFTWFGRMTSRFTFFDSDLQVRLNYRGPRQSPQGNRKAAGSFDLGWSKDFLGKNMTLTLSARDIFNSRKRIGETIFEGFYERSEFQWRQRSVTLSANYRLNQKKKRSRQRGGGDYEGGGEEF